MPRSLHLLKFIKSQNKPKCLTSDKIKATIRITSRTIRIGLEALNESSDVFPPLKSAIGGILFILTLTETMQGNKTAIEDIYQRIDEIQKNLESAMPPELLHFSPALYQAIEVFDA
ncbi:hypothetical protein OF83DRAFT_1168583 [Amylostereum chailletii]|nr:hypothetical protein OF83DRAFT_1168583 [Amylostereum chailletii]